MRQATYKDFLAMTEQLRQHINQSYQKAIADIDWPRSRINPANMKDAAVLKDCHETRGEYNRRIRQSK